jgi:hypothetical protein
MNQVKDARDDGVDFYRSEPLEGPNGKMFFDRIGYGPSCLLARGNITVKRGTNHRFMYKIVIHDASFDITYVKDVGVEGLSIRGVFKLMVRMEKYLRINCDVFCVVTHCL